MAATAEKEYVISGIDYEDEAGYYPLSLMYVRHQYVFAIHFKGELEQAVRLAKSKISCCDEDLGVFWWDHENDHWELDTIIYKYRQDQ